MPGGDKTGPLGQGVGTGRRAGFCYGNNQPGFVTGGGRGAGFGGRGFRGQSNRGMGRGLGRGLGRGFRFRNQVVTDPINEPVYDAQMQELQALREENRQMRETLNTLAKRLDELQSKER